MRRDDAPRDTPFAAPACVHADWRAANRLGCWICSPARAACRWGFSAPGSGSTVPWRSIRSRHGPTRGIFIPTMLNVMAWRGTSPAPSPTNSAWMQVDVLVGGPPCQAYARVGRAKLREIADHPAAFKVDPRGNLYLRYLAWVKALRPLALLVENVPDILHYGHHNVVEEMVDALDGFGYDARYSLINSAFHGCPQMRDRVFLMACRKELAVTVRFPARDAIHAIAARLCRNARGGACGMWIVRGSRLCRRRSGRCESLPGPVTAREAIGDLPAIHGDSVRRGARRFSELSRYAAAEDFSAYAAMMRRWPGFAAGEGVYDHVIRALPRDVPIFRAMRAGAEYPEAHATALELAAREAARRGLRGGHQGVSGTVRAHGAAVRRREISQSLVEA